MWINYYTAYLGKTCIFAASWDSIAIGPSDCTWMVPGTFDCDGNSLLEDM